MRPTLTVLEKIELALSLPLIILPRLILNCARCVSIAWWRALPLHFYIRVGLIRTFLGCLKPRQIQYIAATTIQTYESWINKKIAIARSSNDTRALRRLKTSIETLPDCKSSLLWIGDRSKASKYVLFFHGGGYIAPLTGGHLEWCYRAYVENSNPNLDIAVAVLQYTLCPGARQPTQLLQASAALKHMLDSGVRPCNIVIGGDSAGGNLTAQLLSHLAHGTPQLTLSEPLAGAFTVSPWVSTSTRTRSFLDNQYVDMLSQEIADTSTAALLGESQNPPKLINDQQGWAMPLDIDGGWLDGWWKVSRALYVTVGAQEVLHDQGVRFAEAIRKRNKTMDVRLDIAAADAHDFILLEATMALESGKKTTDTTMPRLTRHRSVIMSFFDRQPSSEE